VRVVDARVDDGEAQRRGEGIAARLRRLAFGISPIEATFARRKFRRTDRGTEERLEKVGHSFICGYMLGLGEGTLQALAGELDRVELAFRGFAYEGAAMALALRDAFFPWRRGRAEEFAAGAGSAHLYMAHVGMGWAWARLHRNPARARARLDPLLGWLAVDGLGFHEGYFHPERTLVDRRRPRRLAGYDARAFDQGLGRALWFVEAAGELQVAEQIGRFEAGRRADLWSGIGLASAYAGGAGEESLQALRKASGEHARELAQGAAFAAQARQRAGNPTEHTELACFVYCGVGAREAALATQTALAALPAGRDQTGQQYEAWRAGIRRLLAREERAP
jgi:hypothetical protein